MLSCRPRVGAHREGGLSLPDLVLLPLRNIDDEIASKSSLGSLSSTRLITQTRRLVRGKRRFKELLDSAVLVQVSSRLGL